MFAVQVRFLDSREKPETVILRRLYASIGSRESCHLILDGVDSLLWELRIRRGIGTRFFVRKVEICDGQDNLKEEVEYLTFGTIVLEDMEFFIYCIDPQVCKLYIDKVDSQLDSLPHDILSPTSQLFPVLYSVTEPQVALSISSLDSFFIGRSRKSLFRLEKRELLPEHIEIFQVGEVWYARPLVGDSRFCVNGKTLNEKLAIQSGDRFSFGSTEILYLDSEADLNRFSQEIGYSLSENSSLRSGHLTILEGPGAPKTIPLVENSLFTVGRDPSHSLWVDQHFISRLHCTILLRGDALEITDFSSNGTIVNGTKLVKERVTIFRDLELQISFGPGVKLVYSAGSAIDLKHNRIDRLVQQLDEKLSSTLLDEASMKAYATSENEVVTFADFQKRTLRQMEESANYETVQSPFIAESKIEDREEVPVQIGVSRFLPQIFIGVLIIVLSIVFVVIAKNIVF